MTNSTPGPASGDKVSGASVHLVERKYDTGPLIAQVRVEVALNDTVETLAQRVRAAEGELLVQVLREFSRTVGSCSLFLTLKAADAKIRQIPDCGQADHPPPRNRLMIATAFSAPAAQTDQGLAHSL